MAMIKKKQGTVARLNAANPWDKEAMYPDGRSAFTTRMYAWLEKIIEEKPFDEVLFFRDAVFYDTAVELAYFNGRTLPRGEIGSASIVFCGPEGVLYDQAALKAFVEGERGEVVYWGPKLGLLATGYENPFADENEHEDANEVAHQEIVSFPDFDGAWAAAPSYEDTDTESESEESFKCANATAHDVAVANLKAIGACLGFVDQKCASPVSEMSFKKMDVVSTVLVTGLPSRHVFTQFDQVPAPRRMRSFERAPRRRDPTVALRAMRANIREAGILPPTRVPRPVLSVIQPVHPMIKAQREAAAALQAQLDPTFEAPPVKRKPVASSFDTSSDEEHSSSGVSPGPWPRRPRPTVNTIQRVSASVFQQRRNAGFHGYGRGEFRRMCGGQPYSDVVGPEYQDLILESFPVFVEEEKKKEPGTLVWNPFKVVGNLFRVAYQKVTRERDWIR